MRLLTLVSLSLLFAAGCSSRKTENGHGDDQPAEGWTISPSGVEQQEGTVISDDDFEYPYRPSRTLLMDIRHLRAEVRFDIPKRHLIGSAQLTMRPYIYPQDSVVLDAKGFDIHQVVLLNGTVTKPSQYRYDSLQLTVYLDRIYKPTDSLVLRIDYTAKPDELPETRKGHAITSDKGLYFINPDGTDSTRPFQIWTQGEVQSNSCWLPTVDAPNEKYSQELLITVPNKYLTLSNGKMISSKIQGDMRTDHWKQTLPHSAYLTAMIVGDFAVIKDKWRDKEVNYYVEKDYAPYARMVFGNTPRMIEYFSQLTGVTFPWDKYSQIVIRDYVSGAMENTTAVTFFERLQHDNHAHLDETYENVISHELFHHWFGDLVTAESWSNLPLNEAFANYGEYLWLDYAYGHMEAEAHRYSEWKIYRNEAAQTPKKLIRYHYDRPDDMFDGHSYQKGGLVFHYLRNLLGDQVFFKSLNIYLTRYAYKTAEIHDLRSIFEEVSGQDLNWFFNEWYFQEGHPEIQSVHRFNPADNMYELEIQQNQEQPYTLPFVIGYHLKDTVIYRNITSTKDEAYMLVQQKLPGEPLWVDIDTGNIVPARHIETKNFEQWMGQYRYARYDKDKAVALDQMMNESEGHEQVIYKALLEAGNDPFWKNRELAMQRFSLVVPRDSMPAELKQLLIKRSSTDEKAAVRKAAINALSIKPDSSLRDLYYSLCFDSSYAVSAEALDALTAVDSKAGTALAESWLTSKSATRSANALAVLALSGKGNYIDWYKRLLARDDMETKYGLIVSLNSYLIHASNAVRKEGIALLKQLDKTQKDDMIGSLLVHSTVSTLNNKLTAELDDIGSVNTPEKAELEALIRDLESIQ